MNFEKLMALIELLRPINGVIVGLAVVVAAVIAGGTASQWLDMVLAALAGALIAGGGNAFNDACDIELDRINKPQRPLPRGSVSPQEARQVWLVSSSLGLFLTTFLAPSAMFIAGFWVIALYAYSKKLKRTMLLGNVLVSLMTALALIYGGVVVGQVNRAVIPAVFAFLINLAREMVKDVEDMEGDAKGEAGTLPLRYGVKSAILLASLVLILLIASTPIPYADGTYTSTYLSIVLVVDLLLTYVIISMWRNWTPPHLNRLSFVLKMSMIAGLAAIYFGS